MIASAQTSEHFFFARHSHSSSFTPYLQPYLRVIMASQDFTSSLTLTDAQKTSLTELEPAFEHLLRDVGLGEATILALRHCRINDRETFTGLADSTEELRTIASDLGINLADGGMPSASTRRYSWLGSERKHRLRSKRVQKRSSVSMANQ